MSKILGSIKSNSITNTLFFLTIFMYHLKLKLKRKRKFFFVNIAETLQKIASKIKDEWNSVSSRSQSHNEGVKML